MYKKPLALAATGLLVAATGACAADSAADDSTSLDVVAAFYPLEFVAQRVGGEQVSVTGLAPPGVEAHDLELTPSQVAEISQADLVVYLTDFQPAVDDAVDAHASAHAFDVANAVALLDATGRPHDDDHDDDDHDDDDHGHEDEDDDHGHEDEVHDHGDQDPHVWLDPDRLATIADELAHQFGELDPDHADDYLANAEQLRQELTALDETYADALANCQRREIVVSHAAFGYLADRYDLRQIAITGLSPEEEPSPHRLAEVIHQARDHGATTIFFEVLVSPDVANVIANEVGATTAVLDPIEGLTPGSDEDYFALMHANLDALRTALDCT